MVDQSIEEKLSQYEEMFKHRYTEQDEDFMTTLNKPLADPPCVENWYSKPRRTYDWSRSDRGRGRGGYNQNRGGQHSGYHNRDRYNPYDRPGQNRHYDDRHGQDSRSYRGRPDQQRYSNSYDRSGPRHHNPDRGRYWT